MGYAFVIAGDHKPAPPPPEEEPPPPVEVPRGTIEHLTQELRRNITAKSSAHRGERGCLRKAFQDIDADKSGYIEMDEFCKALERFGLHTSERGLPGGRGGLSKEVVQALFDSFDRDGSGALGFDEFEEALLMPERPAPPPMLRTKPRLRHGN